MPPATTLDEAIILGANLEGLPHRPKGVETTRTQLANNLERLILVFLHYSRMSGVSTLREATRLRFAGLQQLARDSLLDTRDFDLNAIGRVLATHGEDDGKRQPGTSSKDTGPNPENVELRLDQFLRLLVQLAFCWVHPRHGHALFDAPRPNQTFVNNTQALGKIDESSAVPHAMEKLVQQVLPRMRGNEAAAYRQRLQKDKEAQEVLEAYRTQLEDWAQKLRTSLLKTRADPLEHWSMALDAKRCLGTVSVPITDRNGQQAVYKATLSAAQARVCFLEAQVEVVPLALGKPFAMFETPVLLEALCRCGEVKYGGVVAMDSLAKCVGGMVRNVTGKANEVEVLTEAVVGKDVESVEDLEQRAEQARKANWEKCWKLLVVKDLPGWPMWESELHDVLEPHFADLHSIFVHYCGSSIQGAMSISSATKLGLMEMLQLVKDTSMATRHFSEDEISRHFVAANSQAAIAASGSSERHKYQAGVAPKPDKPKYYDPIAEALRKRRENEVSSNDMQLNLFEFVCFIVKCGFWRCNPLWGSKFNKKDLTPVPDSVRIFLGGFLPRAKRDTSHEFRKVLQSDSTTQAVLSQYRERLHDWLRLALRSDSGNKEAGAQQGTVRMTYALWQTLMDGPDAEQLKPGMPRPACPRMVGEWDCKQESEITGDERVLPRSQITMTAKLSIPQVRWNFLRSQAVEQLTEGEVDDSSDYASLDFAELQEALVRCAVDMFSKAMVLWLPSHDKFLFTRAEAVKAFLRVLLWEATVEHVMWEAALIEAPRFDPEAPNARQKLFHQSEAEWALFKEVWAGMPLMDIYGFPLWEQGVHDCVQRHFAPLMRIFSHYSKGVSGIDSAADALEMELEEFHDFVKDAKLETKLVRFDAMCVVFAKANATNTAEAFEQRKRARRDKVVQAGLEIAAAAEAKKKRTPAHKLGAMAAEYNGEFSPSNTRFKKPDNRLTLTEFIACVVRLSFMRANPKYGTYDNKRRIIPLPDCLEECLNTCILVNAKQDKSQLFREELQNDKARQAVLDEYDLELRYWFSEVVRLTTRSSSKSNKCMTMEVWLDIARGYLTFQKKPGWAKASKAAAARDKAAADAGVAVNHAREQLVSGLKEGGLVMKRHSAKQGETGGMSKWALVGDTSVQRESDITGDERCKEKFTCRLSVLEVKYAFLNSQSLEQMRAAEAADDDAMATLDYDEFCECLCRCADAKYGEIKLIPKDAGLRGLLENLFGRASDEAIIRDATYIYAERYDWADSRPLPGQQLSLHRRWRDCWQCMELADLHHFPLWEKGVHDVLQVVFGQLQQIFAHYAKGATGGETAEDATEMTMTEFKCLVRDVGLETRDFKFDVMTNMFKAANAVNRNAVRAQRKEEQGTSDVKGEEGFGSGVKVLEERSPTRSKRAQSQRDVEVDQECVLYEFVELLVRISFWRANPYHGIHKLATQLIPLPDCLHYMLHEVVLPNAKKDDSAEFREKLQGDPHLQAALRSVEPMLRPWFNVHTQSIFLREHKRALQFQQWQDLLKRGWGTCAPGTAGAQVGYSPGYNVGTWETYQDSEITGDERCRDVHRCALSFPVAKMAFLNSQSLDQMTVGQSSNTSDITTLDYAEFEECIARCALEKYKSIVGPTTGPMRQPQMIIAFVNNLLGIEVTEESMNTATLIRCERYEWRRLSKPLPFQPLKEHKQWLAVWQRLELSDLHYFPVWEEQLHDLLQRHFKDLRLIFLAYSRSVLGSDSAEDATEMEMAEFYDFVSECHLETKVKWARHTRKPAAHARARCTPHRHTHARIRTHAPAHTCAYLHPLDLTTI